MSRRPRWLPHPGYLALSIILLLSALVPLAYVVAPHVDRWRRLAPLTSDDLVLREKALNYVIRTAPDDPRVLRGAVERLGVEDEQNFLQIVIALDSAGLWTKDNAGPDAWRRWLVSLAGEENPEARIIAAQMLADAAGDGVDAQTVELIDVLSRDEDPDVRYNALIAAGQLAKGNESNARLLGVIADRIMDEESAIATSALLLAQMFPSAAVPRMNLAEAEDEVALAAFWGAAPHTPPGRLDAAIRNGTPNVRDAAVYAASRVPSAAGALTELIATPIDAIDSANLVAIWRAVLAAPLSDEVRASLGRFGDPALDRRELEPIILSAHYRLGTPEPIDPTGDPRQTLRLLASLEGAEAGSTGVAFSRDMPELLRLIAVWKNREARPDDLWPLFFSALPTMRDLACVVAIDRFDRDANADLARRLLAEFDDHAKMSGAVLSGMARANADVLQRRLKIEQDWSVLQVLKLGLWMQGLEAEDAPPPRVLLTRPDDVPATTVLLAMLYRGDPDARRQALDHLLNPRGEQTLDLVELFDQLRWWYVLERFLPDDAPPFWVWGDPELTRFQVKALRDWYLVNRRGLTDGIVKP